MVIDDIIRDVGDRHYSEVQRHPGGRVSTKVIHVMCSSDDSEDNDSEIVDENTEHISCVSLDRNLDCEGGNRGEEEASPTYCTSTSPSSKSSPSPPSQVQAGYFRPISDYLITCSYHLIR